MTFRPDRRTIKCSVSTETNILIQRAAAELKTAREDVAAARSPVDVPVLRVYDQMAARGMPVVVAVHGSKCGGCHLKISSEAESAARGKGNPGELARCDQCGRIIYWEN